VVPVSESLVPPTALSEGNALSEGDAARLEELPRAPEEGPGHPAAAPQLKVAARPSGWTAGRIAALVIGTLLVLVALGLLGAAGVGFWGETQRDGGYVTTSDHEFSTSGSALTTEPTDLGSTGIAWLYSPGLLGKVRIRVTPVSPGPALFVGIGPSAAVDRYLAGVNHTRISDFWGNKVQDIGGGTPGSAPATQPFWVASATGPGARTLVWHPAGGSWTAVVMNADGQPGIDVKADLGAKLPALLWIAVGFLAGGAVLLVGGVLLIAGAIRRRRAGPPRTGPQLTADVRK
jgi:hypothetical protein